MSKLMLAGGKAFLISLVFTPIVRDVFRAYNVVDRPGRRKVHAYPIPRVGGLPIAIGFTVALLSLAVPEAVGSTATPSDWIWKLLPGAAIIFVTGLVDDFFDLKPLMKLIGEIAAAGAVYAAGLRIQAIGDYPLPDWLSLPLTLFWLLLATNAQNLIDGLDGLCTGMGFFATVTFVCAGLIQQNSALVGLALPLGGALLGFLVYNFYPATVFLGDSGALTIGFLLGCYGLVWTEKPTGVLGSLVPLLAMAIPMMDLSLSIVRRSLRGQPIFSADRGHIHHRLLDRGFPVRRSALTLYGISLVATGFAVLMSYPVSGFLHGVVLVGFILAGWAGIRQLRYPEFTVAAKLTFRGEWRRAFQRNLRLEQLRGALKNAKTEDEWWATVVAVAHEAHWVRLRRAGQHPSLETILSDKQAEWSFSIVLGEDDVVQVDGMNANTERAGVQPLIDLAGFSEVLRTTLPARRRQPALL